MLSSNSELTSTFYHGKFYDLIFGSSYRYAIQSQDIDFWRSMAQNYGSPVLELACGTGRIGAILANEGLKLTGIEISESMLETAQAKSQAAQWIQANVCNFDLKTQFPLIIFPYDTLTHLHSFEEVSQCLKCVRNHLDLGGHFIIDLKNPHYIFDILENPDRIDFYSQFTHPEDGSQIEVKRKRRYDSWKQIHTMTLLFYRNQVQFNQEDLNLRIFWPQEITKILQDNHFEIIQVWGDYQYGQYGDQSSHMILDCKAIPLV
ncbi:class I SAM-dependent DNA methyltransferase [Cylindrospermopsis curvispora]|uniref:Class I SAM-dependent methyltransferase n=1 Tax=Cylindrospermopsis curvispora GIHE-G1 TaxID=2666332 RepID=A0A7H0F308_9CYAN|nr:class I SAM-dependent methyltransferase [Cylindrospermopsis curvispora]QNP30424.1 class I SAM-dependent methyltransferase [Cylindrospermopsis curvispora GIHE-G1]